MVDYVQTMYMYSNISKIYGRLCTDYVYVLKHKYNLHCTCVNMKYQILIKCKIPKFIFKICRFKNR